MDGSAGGGFSTCFEGVLNGKLGEKVDNRARKPLVAGAAAFAARKAIMGLIS